MVDIGDSRQKGGGLENSSGVSSSLGPLPEGLLRGEDKREYCGNCGEYVPSRMGEIYRCQGCGNGRGD